MSATLDEKRYQFIQDDFKNCIETYKYTHIDSNKFFEELMMNMFEYKNLYFVYNRYIVTFTFESNNPFIPFYIFKNTGFKSDDIIKFKVVNENTNHFDFYKTLSKIFVIPVTYYAKITTIIPSNEITIFKNTHILNMLCKKSLKYDVPYTVYTTYPKKPNLGSIYKIPENMLDETAYNYMRINEIKNV